MIAANFRHQPLERSDKSSLAKSPPHFPSAELPILRSQAQEATVADRLDKVGKLMPSCR